MKEEIERTLTYEGGYSLDESDPGGETNFGISKRYHPNVDVKNLTKEKAVEIYKLEYWDKLQLDIFKNARFRFKVFDISVNQGPGIAASFLHNVRDKDTIFGVWELVEMQMKRYVEKVKENPVKLKYLRGWTVRAFDTGEGL